MSLLCQEAKFTAMQMTEPKPMSGMKWYFEWPQGPHGVPLEWVNPNRETRVDPELLDITEVYKFKEIPPYRQHSKPPFWESAFIVHCILAAPDGSQLATGINLFCFTMNQAWRGHNVVKFLEKWVVARDNLKYLGNVLNAPEPLPPRCPSRLAAPESAAPVVP